MSLRAKLISTVSAFVLVLALMTMGVYAVLTQSINLGGSISFQAQDVQATISKGVVAGGTLTDAENKLQAITIDADSNGSDQIATWSDLDLSFAESGEDVTITFDITNNHPEKALLVKMTPNSGSADNATMTVKATNGDYESLIIGAKGDGEAQKATYVVTFHVEDKNKDASITNFNIDINLKLAESYTATLNITDDSDGHGTFYWETDNGQSGSSTGSEGVDDKIVLENVREITFWCYGPSGAFVNYGDEQEIVSNSETTLSLTEDTIFNITINGTGGSGGTM